MWLFTCIDEIVWSCSLAIWLHTKEIDSFILVQHWHLSVLKIDLVKYIFIMIPLCSKNHTRPLVTYASTRTKTYLAKTNNINNIDKTLILFSHIISEAVSFPINNSCIFFSPFCLTWICMNLSHLIGCFWYTEQMAYYGTGINWKQNSIAAAYCLYVDQIK